ncbi:MULTISPECIES: GMC family oxidoreductase [Nitrospirillum]|uniref:Gluconate 2-dehydrogenase alpha chain n=1 Tax=Nitrospirillum amazonense TaxID=28077 RepID=A0A560FJA8_9PROT|nr:GMC family oxidoreductase [Nitrospirillum amazonense]MEC4592331.1 GMC family oxidoreductase [Nitrospirillum amazonense]TWB21688.1 gluconate 2-dehydrogenase alpha chain [Nitrospirillum amazonense]
MSEKLPSVDVLVVGFGWTGAIVAQELTDAGLNVLALERGRWRDTPTDFAPTFAQDELRYMWRHALFENLAHNTLTIRNNTSQTALPMRVMGSFLPGTGVGGSGVHWNGQTWRFLPSDLEVRSHVTRRYGAKAIPADMTIQDFGVTYDDLEPHYDRFEYLCGTSGTAGNLNGQIQAGGNPFEGARKRAYPTPAMRQAYAPTLFAEAAARLGYHPFPQPSSNLSEAYTNPLGVQLGPCTYCGFCEKFGCGNYSKATAQTTILPVLMRKPNFTLRTEAEALTINRDSTGKRAVSVTYVDAQGREFEQPADLIFLGTYALNNVRLLLLSGIGTPYDPRTGQGVVGRNYAYQRTSFVNAFFDDKILNPFIGAGAHGMHIDDFNGDNFDHGGLGFLGGGYFGVLQTGARPIETHPVPEGTPTWGGAWKKAVAANYLKTTTISTHGGVMSHRGNYLDLDPTYRDVYGRPLLRMTFDYTDNEQKMAHYITDRAADVARAMGPREIKVVYRDGSWDVVPYQTTHNTGGAIMGADPKTSVVNRYLQSWDVSNLFIMGASAFPQNPGYNPTGTVAALAYWSLKAVREQYLKSPGPLVHT